VKMISCDREPISISRMAGHHPSRDVFQKTEDVNTNGPFEVYPPLQRSTPLPPPRTCSAPKDPLSLSS
jgi:hypothetical protein